MNCKKFYICFVSLIFIIPAFALKACHAVSHFQQRQFTKRLLVHSNLQLHQSLNYVLHVATGASGSVLHTVIMVTVGSRNKFPPLSRPSK